MKRLFELLMAILLLFMLSACDSGKPEDLIDEDIYIDLLVETELLSTVQAKGGDTDLVLRLFDAILAEYDITSGQFDRSHEWYQQDVEGQIVRHRIAVERLREIQSQYNQWKKGWKNNEE
jgi:hypothetical protein